MISAHLDLFCHVDPISSVEICMLGNRMLIVIIVVPSQSIRIQTFIVFVLYVNTFFNASDFFKIIITRRVRTLQLSLNLV